MSSIQALHTTKLLQLRYMTLRSVALTTEKRGIEEMWTIGVLGQRMDRDNMVTNIVKKMRWEKVSRY